MTGSPTDRVGRQRQPSRRPSAAILVVGALVLPLMGASLVVATRSDGSGSAQARLPEERGGAAETVSFQGRDLAGLLAKGIGATYHARYQSAIADPRSTGTHVVMDIWRKGHLGRQELSVQAQGAKSRTATFLLPPDAVECSQVGDKPWTCEPPTKAHPPEAPEVQVGKTLAQGRIAARDERIAGLPVRCFTYPPAAEIEETCLLADGVLARMATSSSRFDLIALSPSVPDDVFELPVQP